MEDSSATDTAPNLVTNADGGSQCNRHSIRPCHEAQWRTAVLMSCQGLILCLLHCCPPSAFVTSLILLRCTAVSVCPMPRSHLVTVALLSPSMFMTRFSAVSVAVLSLCSSRGLVNSHNVRCHFHSCRLPSQFALSPLHSLSCTMSICVDGCTNSTECNQSTKDTDDA